MFTISGIVLHSIPLNSVLWDKYVDIDQFILILILNHELHEFWFIHLSVYIL